MLFRRAAADEEDDDDPLGRQALAVHGEPSNEDSPPCDGLEYLRRVRKQANMLPAIVTANIEPSRLRAAEERTAARLASTVVDDMLDSLPPPPAAVRPYRRWQLQLLHDFRAVRTRAEQCGRERATTATAVSQFPRPHDATGWALFLDLRVTNGEGTMS